MKLQLPGKVYVLILGGIGLAGVGSYMAIQSENKEREILTHELPANVISTDVRRLADPETAQERSVDILVTYEY